MFDFFKDVYYQSQGFDLNKIHAEQERKRKLQIPKKEIIIGFGVLYLVVATMSVSTILQTGFSWIILRYAGLLLLDIAGIVLFLTGKKGLAYIIFSAFVILNFLFSPL